MDQQREQAEVTIETNNINDVFRVAQIDPEDEETAVSETLSIFPIHDTDSMVKKWMQINSEMPQLKRMIHQRLDGVQETLDKIGKFEQKSQEWLDARKFRLTASNFGAALGHNKYQSKKTLVCQMLWHSFSGNEATRYGEMNEGPARTKYLEYLKKTCPDYEITIDVPGLFVSAKYPFLGCSPDGLVTMTHKTDANKSILFLLEIKCPYSKKYYPQIPPYYYDQIQGIMALKNLPHCDFVVYLETEFRIQRFVYNQEYAEKTLLP